MYSKKVSSLMIAILAIVMLVSGCMVKPGDTNKQNPAPTAGGATPAPQQQEKTYDPIKIDYMVAIDKGTDDSQFIAKRAFKEVFNVDVNFIINNWNNMNEKLRVMIATNELPDIISPMTDGYGKECGPKGMLVPFDEYLDRMPNFKSYLLKDPKKYVALQASDGHIYNAPQISEVLKVSTATVIRGDLLKEAGVEPPKTMKELAEVIKAVKKFHPEVVGLVNSGKMNFLWNRGVQYNTNNGMHYDPTTDKWIYAPLYEGFKEMLMDYHYFWAEGLMDPEFFTATNPQVREKFANGQAIYNVLWAHNVPSFEAEYKAKNPDDKDYELAFIMPLTTDVYPKTVTKIDPMVNNWSSLAVSAKSKYVDRILEMVEWMYSDEGITTLQWGYEGETYTEDADGKRKFMDNIMWASNPNGQIDAVNVLGLESSHLLRVRRNDYAVPPYPEHVQAAIDMYMNESDVVCEEQFGINLTFTEEQQSRIAEINTTALTIVEETAAKLIIGEMSFDKYDEFIKQLEAVGVREVEEIYAKAYDEYKKKLDAVK